MLMARRNMMDGKLPYDSKVEWLKSTRGNYIDTGFVLGDVRTFRWTANAMTKGQLPGELPIMSCWTYDTKWTNLFFGGSGGIKSLSMFAQQDSGHLRPKTVITEDVMLKISCGMDFEGVYGFKGERFIGVNEGSFNTINLVNYPFNPNNILILARGDRSFDNSAYVQSVKIEIGLDVVLDCIAVRKDGIGYMYDKVSKQLLGNRGSGLFEIGPDKS